MSDQSPWDAFRPQEPRQGQGQPQYPSPQPAYWQQQGQSPYPPQHPYGQQPAQPSLMPGPQYAPSSGDPRYQGQPPYYQGQPYGPPGSQPPYPGPGYGYGPPQVPPPRRKRHVVRNVLLGVGGLIVVIIAIGAAAGGGTHTVTTGQTTTAPATQATASAKPSPSATAAGTATAHVGSTITLSGDDPGEQMAVTVVQVFRHAQAATEFDEPDAGDRLYAVQFRLDDTGNAAYSDAPSNGAEVVDAAGQSYQSSYQNVSECESFPGTENIAPGQSGLGCVVFEVPETAVITEVQFMLDSGFGPQTGQWDVRA